MEAAFWWQDENQWRFIVATPVVLSVLSLSEGVLTVLDIPLNRLILGEQICSAYVLGAYIYLFAPKTFAPA